MAGDRGAGEYNLRILGVERGDEGYWECQVSGPPPLREGAHLWVDLPPTAIALEPAEEGRVGTNTTLTCRVLGGRPVATVVWRRAGAEFTGIEVVTAEEEVAGGRTTVASSLVFGPQPSDNGAVFECLGQHPATPGGLRAALTLSVLYPPGRPVVTVVGHARGQVLRAGQEVTLHCESWGGEPRATLAWLRDGQRVDPTGWTNRDERAVSEHRFTVKEEDNNAVFKCEATSSRLELVLVEAIQLVVEFATSKVELSGPETGEVGDVLTFECDSGTSNPASTLHWVVDSRNMTANYTTTEAADHGGFVTRSNLTLAITESVRYRQVNCYADNLALTSEHSFASHRVTVTYPPDHLSVSGYTTGQVCLLLLLLLFLLLLLLFFLLLLRLFFLLLLHPGQVLQEKSATKLKCTVRTGNPLPELAWFRGKKKMESETSEQFNEEKVKISTSSEITIVATRKDNGKKYRCKAVKPGEEEEYYQDLTKERKLTVHFLPTAVEIKVTPDKLVENQVANLTCTTAPSNPATTIRWQYNNQPLPADGSSSEAEAKFNGFTTTSFVLVTLTTGHVEGRVQCEARDQHNHSVHNQLTLDVEYSPQVAMDTIP